MFYSGSLRIFNCICYNFDQSVGHQKCHKEVESLSLTECSRYLESETAQRWQKHHIQLCNFPKILPQKSLKVQHNWFVMKKGFVLFKLSPFSTMWRFLSQLIHWTMFEIYSHFCKNLRPKSCKSNRDSCINVKSISVINP